MKEIDNKKKSTKIIQLFYPPTFNNKGIIVIYSLYLYFFFFFYQTCTMKNTNILYSSNQIKF